MSPIWLASLTNLKELYLNHATELISLPPLRMISCLESLTIKFAERLKKVGVEFLGIESENKKEDIKIFPNSQKWILPTRPNQKTRDISNLGIFLCLLSCFQILFPKIQIPLFLISPQTL